MLLEAQEEAFLAIIRKLNFWSTKIDREILTLMVMSAIIIIVRWSRVFENYPLLALCINVFLLEIELLCVLRFAHVHGTIRVIYQNDS